MNQESVLFALAQSIPEPHLGDTEVKLFGSQVKQLMKAGVAFAEEDISGLGTWSFILLLSSFGLDFTSIKYKELI